MSRKVGFGVLAQSLSGHSPAHPVLPESVTSGYTFTHLDIVEWQGNVMSWKDSGFGSHVDHGLNPKSPLTSYAILGKEYSKPVSSSVV